MFYIFENHTSTTQLEFMYHGLLLIQPRCLKIIGNVQASPSGHFKRVTFLTILDHIPVSNCKQRPSKAFCFIIHLNSQFCHETSIVAERRQTRSQYQTQQLVLYITCCHARDFKIMSACLSTSARGSFYITIHKHLLSMSMQFCKIISENNRKL